MLTLWNKWLSYTFRKAFDRCAEDMLVYGSGAVERHWWGYRYVPIYSVTK